MMKLVSMLALCASLFVAACASRPDAPLAPAGPPSLAITPGQPAPPQARFYAGCISQATQSSSYDREQDLLRFHCSGELAHAFFDALGPYSAAAQSEMQGDGRTWRFTARLQQNPTGADYCWRDAANGYGCTVVLNVGEFLAYQGQ
ncbi:hypothetical protein [Terricaulis sp.]|uniref:hypothetical protein n=1 Tax=Terricaulis sp. TaxID=2768686 RepID=UPI003783E2A6